jgi:hypothetical protein
MGCCSSINADKNELTIAPFEKTNIEKPSISLKIISLNILAQSLIDTELPGYEKCKNECKTEKELRELRFKHLKRFL